MIGITISSSSPSDTKTEPSAWNVFNTDLISAAIYSSACTPLPVTPVTVITCALYPLLTKSSYVFIAEKIALESASSGSSNASLCAASIQASLPITGVVIPVFSPTSSSLSTQITSNLLAVDDWTSFSTLPFSDMSILCQNYFLMISYYYEYEV